MLNNYMGQRGLTWDCLKLGRTVTLHPVAMHYHALSWFSHYSVNYFSLYVYLSLSIHIGKSVCLVELNN